MSRSDVDLVREMRGEGRDLAEAERWPESVARFREGVEAAMRLAPTDDVYLEYLYDAANDIGTFALEHSKLEVARDVLELGSARLEERWAMRHLAAVIGVLQAREPRLAACLLSILEYGDVMLFKELVGNLVTRIEKAVGQDAAVSRILRLWFSGKSVFDFDDAERTVQAAGRRWLVDELERRIAATGPEVVLMSALARHRRLLGLDERAAEAALKALELGSQFMFVFEIGYRAHLEAGRDSEAEQLVERVPRFRELAENMKRKSRRP